MTEARPRARLWLVRAVAVGATLGLAWAVVKAGGELMPPELDPVRITWDFRDNETPIWESPNGRTSRGRYGLVVVSVDEPAMIMSGPLDYATTALERLRVRLSLRQAAQGQVGLVVRSPDGVTRVTASFQSAGGGKFEDIVVPVSFPDRSDLRVLQAVLVPSVIPQEAIVSAIRFEPDESALALALRELVSASPGRAASVQGNSVNSLSPPVIVGRSMWVALTPVALLAGMLARVISGTGGACARLRRVGWTCVGAVWALGVGLTAYHQVVALAADVASFGGGGRAEAYGVIDGVPLWEDMQAIARVLSADEPVRVVVDARADSLVRALWTGRATYYLYPVLVRESSPATIYYFGGQHPPCTQIASGQQVLAEGSRYCVLRAGL